jgi:hypothetical protein
MPTLKDNRGIRILDTQLDDLSGQVGRYDILYHSNGNIYIVFARTDLTGSLTTRQIWGAVSTDGGITFTGAVQLTPQDGHWHDGPTLCQIEPGDPASDIGVVFASSTTWNDTVNPGGNDPYPYRFLLDTDLQVISAIDILTNYTKPCWEGCLLRGTNKFLYFAMDGTADYMIIWENQINEENQADGFLDNAWVRRYISNFGGGTDLLSFRMHTLSNGHILCLFTGQTTIVGSSPLTDLYYTVSDDDGYTWTTPVALTAYAGTPKQADLVGLQMVLGQDFAELSTGSLALVYQEGKASQELGYYSTPQFNVSNSQTPFLLEALNYLLIPRKDIDNGGIYVFDLTTQAFIFKIIPSTTPPVWSPYCYNIAVSPDEKYMAVGTDTSLDIFHIEDADPANWTVTSLRKTTTPALAKRPVNWVRFTDNTTLVFGYASDPSYPGASYVWGGKVDASNPVTITPLYCSTAFNTRYLAATNPQLYIDAINGLIYAVSNKHFWVTRISDGAGLRGITINVNCDEVFYDDINDEYVLTNANGIYRYTDNGTALTLVDTLLKTSTPYMFPDYPQTGITYPGSGIMFQMDGPPTWYDFTTRKCVGPLLNYNEDYTGFNSAKARSPRVPAFARDDEWVMHATNSNTPAQAYLPMKHIGHLRWGIFPYNPATKTIGADTFYDLVDESWVPPDDCTRLVMPRVCPTADDDVALAAFRYFPGRLGGRPLAFVTGVMSLEHKTLGIRACILKVTTQTLDARARILIYATATLGIKAQIHTAQCLKMQAWIIPKQTQTLQIKAVIRGLKTTSWTGQFTVLRTGQRRLYRLRFTTNTGYTGTQEMTARARIIAFSSKKFTGHFIVPANPTAGTDYTFTVDMNHRRFFSMKAFLVSSR